MSSESIPTWVLDGSSDVYDNWKAMTERIAELKQQVAYLTADLQSAASLLGEAQMSVSDLEAERDRLREALKAIIKHQQTVGGDLSHLSTTLNIAKKALEDSDEL